MGIHYEHTVTISMDVTDFEASKAWYQDVLGLTLQYEVPEIGWCEFETAVPGTTIGLNVVEEKSAGASATPTLGVTDAAAARAFLESKGVNLVGDNVEIEGLVILVNFTDPDGNPLCFAQGLAGQG